MYIRLSDKKYPVSLGEIRAENPGLGIPDDAVTDAVIDFGYARVETTQAPSEVSGKIIVEGVPAQVDGAYRQVWNLVDKTPEEMSAERKRQEAEAVKAYDAVVQKRIDDAARSLGYGDPNNPAVSPIVHAVGYAEEPAVVEFQAEGRLLRAFRSRTWKHCADMLAAVKAGTRTPPSEAELLAELDAAVPWPTEADVQAEIVRLTA